MVNPFFKKNNGLYVGQSPDLREAGGKHAERGGRRPHNHYGLTRLTNTGQ